MLETNKFIVHNTVDYCLIGPHVGAKEKAQIEFGSIKHKNIYNKIIEREPRKRLN